MHKREIRGLLCAMLLGDGCLHVNPAKRKFLFHLGHSQRQVDYLNWKVSLINDCFEKHNSQRRCKIREVIHKLNGKEYPSVQSNLYWKDYISLIYSKIYKNGKKTLPFLLNNIYNDLHLAIWFADDGSETAAKYKHKDGTKYRARPYLKLFTYAYTKGEHNLLIQWFEQNYNVTPRIVNSRKGPFIWFRTKDSIELFRCIAPYLEEIESMRQKFKFSFNKYWPVIEDTPFKEGDDIVQTTTERV